MLGASHKSYHLCDMDIPALFFTRFVTCCLPVYLNTACSWCCLLSISAVISASKYFFSSPGPMLAADHMNTEKINKHFLSNREKKSTCRFNEEPYEHFRLVHSKVSQVNASLCLQVPKDSKPVCMFYETKSSEGPKVDQALTCSLLRSLVLSKHEQGGWLHSTGQPLPEHMVLSKRGSCVSWEIPRACNCWQHQAASELQPMSAEENRRMRGLGWDFLPTLHTYLWTVINTWENMYLIQNNTLLH